MRDADEIRGAIARGEPLTQVEVAALLGLHRQTVWAIEQRALAKLRAGLAEYAPERELPRRRHYVARAHRLEAGATSPHHPLTPSPTHK